MVLTTASPRRGDFVHVGDHRQEPLRCGESGGERTGLQSSVEGSGGAALALHLDYDLFGLMGYVCGRLVTVDGSRACSRPPSFQIGGKQYLAALRRGAGAQAAGASACE
jgi:hypothetical protein